MMEEKRQNVRVRLMALFSDGDKHLTIDDLVDALGNKKTTIYHACKSLVSEGLLARDKKGAWHRKVEISQQSRALRDRVFGTGKLTSDLEKLLDKIGEESFWVELAHSGVAGDLMLAALQRLFERLRSYSEELAKLKPYAESLEVQNDALLLEIGNLKEGARVLRKQRDEALAKAAKDAFVEHGGKR